MGVPMADSKDALELLEREIAKRLRSVCSHMPEEDFNAMVRDIARFKLKHQTEENGGDASGSSG
jgi:hypothetical protein